MAQRIKSDWTLFGAIVGMVFFGLVMVYSSSSVMAQEKYGESWYFLIRQVGWAAASFAALLYAKKYDYRLLKRPEWAFGSLGAVLFLLVVVYFTDSHAHRWFRIPFGSLQPSEFAKPALVIFLAYFLTRRKEPDVNERHMIQQCALALTTLAFAVVVADLGTAIVLIGTAVAVLFVAGLEKRYFTAALLALALFACVAVAIKPYRLMRVITFADPDFTLLDTLDPSGNIKKYMSKSETTHDAGYQIRQAEIAVGSGGLTGLGLMQSRQKWFFLPEAHTDTIFAIEAEELGFFGAFALVAGFLVIFWRGLRLFWTAPDDFGRYLALGVTACITIQAFTNMTVTLGMAPTKGIPLPMISFGGSSLLSTLLCLGILLSVGEQSE